jgi:mannose-6-phosphate isomerase-like protein (cupin superfamily)
MRRNTLATGEVQTDNGVFRVTKWTIGPNDAIPMHVHHYDYVVVPLVDDVMLVRSADGTEATAEIHVGVSYERKAGAEHTVINPGSNVIEFVEVERLS